MECKKSLKKFLENRALITIEASLVSSIFLAGYLVLNSIAISLITESISRRALFELGMDLSAYLQVVDRIGMTDYIATDENGFSNLQKKMMSQIVNEIEMDNLFDNIVNITKNNIISSGKTFAYNKLLKPIYIQKLKSINGYSNLNILGIKEIVNNANFSNTKIFQNGNQLELNLSYEFNIDNFGVFSNTNTVNQKVVIDNWINNFSNNNSFDSIWNKSNFERGKHFVNKLRSNSDIPIKKGTEFDFYDTNSNTLYQVVSLNIFTEFYSEKVGELFEIKESFNRQISKYMNKIKKNYEKYKDKIKKQSGEELNISNPKFKLIVIMPEEALLMNNIQKTTKLLEYKTELEFKYMEKIFNDS